MVRRGIASLESFHGKSPIDFEKYVCEGRRSTTVLCTQASRAQICSKTMSPTPIVMSLTNYSLKQGTKVSIWYLESYLILGFQSDVLKESFLLLQMWKRLEEASPMSTRGGSKFKIFSWQKWSFSACFSFSFLMLVIGAVIESACIILTSEVKEEGIYSVTMAIDMIKRSAPKGCVPISHAFLGHFSWPKGIAKGVLYHYLSSPYCTSFCYYLHISYWL